MTQLQILHYPHSALRQRCAPVIDFDADLARFCADLAETMYAAGGVGLAANQVGDTRRVFVVDVTGGHDLRVFINPEITERIGEQVTREGCLSMPGKLVDVKRADMIGVRAQATDGNWFGIGANDVLAVVIQHEIDHLEGVLMVDRWFEEASK